MSTNSRKTMKTIPIWVRSWPRNILNLKTVKPYPPKQCVPMLLYLPPPYRPHWENLQLVWEVWDVNISDWELLTPSTLPQMSTLAKIGTNVKVACPNSQSSLMSYGLRGTMILPTHVQDCRPSWTSAELRCYSLCCQDADPCELTTMKLQLFPPPIHSNNQCYFIFNRLDSPNKGKYF